VRLAAREVGRHGMVWGSSGAGKSYGLVIITNGWSAAGTRRLQLIDPKGETYLLKSLHIAADYLDLPDAEREAVAARFRVFDEKADALTPFNLFAVPKGMSPSLLASLRAAATRHMSGHDYSDLMEYGVFLLYSAAINAQCVDHGEVRPRLLPRCRLSRADDPNEDQRRAAAGFHRAHRDDTADADL
jgi:hypothetical protein